MIDWELVLALSSSCASRDTQGLEIRYCTASGSCHTDKSMHLKYGVICRRKWDCFSVSNDCIWLQALILKTAALRKFQIRSKCTQNALLVTNCFIRINVMLKNWIRSDLVKFIILIYWHQFNKMFLYWNKCNVLQSGTEFKSSSVLLQYVFTE